MYASSSICWLSLWLLQASPSWPYCFCHLCQLPLCCMPTHHPGPLSYRSCVVIWYDVPLPGECLWGGSQAALLCETWQRPIRFLCCWARTFGCFKVFLSLMMFFWGEKKSSFHFCFNPSSFLGHVGSGPETDLCRRQAVVLPGSRHPLGQALYSLHSFILTLPMPFCTLLSLPCSSSGEDGKSRSSSFPT